MKDQPPGYLKIPTNEEVDYMVSGTGSCDLPSHNICTDILITPVLFTGAEAAIEVVGRHQDLEICPPRKTRLLLITSVSGGWLPSTI